MFENTHPALATKGVWDIVQRVWQNKRRRINMDEQDKYSGPVVCADYGKATVLHRAHTKKPEWSRFTCRTYKKSGPEVCTGHYIREVILDEVVLEDLRSVTAIAREHTWGFAEYIGGKQSAETQRDTRKLEKEPTFMRKRSTKLDAIFKRLLYEESVLGRIMAEQLHPLSGSYTEEMQTLQAKIPGTEVAIQELWAKVSDTEHFTSLTKQYTDIQELTPELLRWVIQKIVVHEKDVQWSKHAQQTVKIPCSDIGCAGADMNQTQSAEESA